MTSPVHFSTPYWKDGRLKFGVLVLLPIFIFLKFVFIFREGNIDQLPSKGPRLRTEPATQTCALTGN